MAMARPTGPAPTINTSTSRFIGRLLPAFLALPAPSILSASRAAGPLHTAVLPFEIFIGNKYSMLGLVESNAERLPATSQTTVAYNRLRGDILAGRLTPGERLKGPGMAKGP